MFVLINDWFCYDGSVTHIWGCNLSRGWTRIYYKPVVYFRHHIQWSTHCLCRCSWMLRVEEAWNWAHGRRSTGSGVVARWETLALSLKEPQWWILNRETLEDRIHNRQVRMLPQYSTTKLNCGPLMSVLLSCDFAMATVALLTVTAIITTSGALKLEEDGSGLVSDLVCSLQCIHITSTIIHTTNSTHYTNLTQLCRALSRTQTNSFLSVSESDVAVFGHSSIHL